MSQTGLFDHLVVVSSFSIGRNELIRAMRQVKVSHRLTSRDGYFVKCELFCMEGKALLRLYENEVVLPVAPVGFCRVEFYLKDALEALQANRAKEVTISITRKTIGFNTVNLTADVKDLDPAKKEIPLSVLKETVKPTDPYEPSKYKNYFTTDKTRGFYNFEVQKDIEVISKILDKYKIKHNEIETFVHFFLRTKI
jgi:hypothetical protein